MAVNDRATWALSAAISVLKEVVMVPLLLAIFSASFIYCTSYVPTMQRACRRFLMRRYCMIPGHVGSRSAFGDVFGGAHLTPPKARGRRRRKERCRRRKAAEGARNAERRRRRKGTQRGPGDQPKGAQRGSRESTQGGSPRVPYGIQPKGAQGGSREST